MILLAQNWVAIITLTIFWTLFGAIWYSPKVFGKLWMRAQDIKEDALQESAMRNYTLSTLVSLAGVVVLSVLIDFTGANSWFEGAYIGFWLWLGPVATTLLMGLIWEPMKWPVFWIHVVYYLVSYITLGAILAIW